MLEEFRAIGGFLTILTLLVLVILDVVVPGMSLSLEKMRYLAMLVGILLATDVVIQLLSNRLELPITIDTSSSHDSDRDRDRDRRRE